MVHTFIVARYPELGLAFVNRGVSGNTSRNLLARWGLSCRSQRS